MSQDKSVIDRLGARRVSGQELYIKYDAATQSYSYTDTSGSTLGVIGTDQYFAYKGGNVFHVKRAFLNPLRYKLEVVSNTVDNPTSQSYDEFLKAFSTAFADIEKVSSIAPTSPVLKDARVAAPALTPKVTTALLHEWYYRLLVDGPFTHTQAKDDALAADIATLEGILFEKIAIKSSPQKLNVEEWLLKFKKDLFFKETFAKFQAEFKGVEDSLIVLTTRITDAQAAYDRIKKILQADKPDSYLYPVLNAANLSSTSKEALFLNYSLNTLGNFTRTVDPLLTARLAKVKEFSNFLTTISKAMVKFTDHELKMEKRKDIKVKITITEFDLNGKELDKKYSTEFHVIYFQPLVPYFSAAFVWSPHKFYNYTLADNGTEKVIQESVEKRYWQPAVFLNWFVNLGVEDFHLIAPQIGVGTGGELPILYTGIGCAIRERLAFSLGGSYAFEKRLSTKHPGEVVADEATLKGDLTHQVSVRMYLSLTYRIGK